MRHLIVFQANKRARFAEESEGQGLASAADVGKHQVYAHQMTAGVLAPPGGLDPEALEVGQHTISKGTV